MWKDQAEFNQNFFPPATDFSEQSRQTKEFVLCVMSELDELLRSVEWKTHRRRPVQPNVDQVRNELTDLLKYLISLAIVWGIKPEEVIADYWRKSMVCRQRFSEEFVLSLDGPMVICDIDGVLADYYTGFLRWTGLRYPELYETTVQLLRPDVPRVWLDHEALKVDPQRWQEIKHQFRVSRGKLTLPLYPYGRELLQAIRKQGWHVVLLTSRPIDAYPNMYTDTLEWLQRYDLPFDCIWWSKDKGEKILEAGVRQLVQYVVDDDPKYALQMARMGLKTYVVNPNQPITGLLPNMTIVPSLEAIIRREHGNL